jgi:6-phosphofructokinase 1
MGRNAGYIALWCGVANGAEDILLPEKYDYNEQAIINNIINNRKRGKTHHIIINAEGIGHSTSMARRIEAATGMETRATILGYMQRGGSPTCKDRYYASIMGAYAADILCEGKTNRVVAHANGGFVDYDIDEAAKVLGEKKIKKCPVLEDGKLVGVISRSEILRYALSSYLEKEAAKAE